MTDGMVRGLEQPTATGSSVFTELQELLSQQSVHRGAIYLTGHSLGGALAIAFAQLLSVRSAVLRLPIERMQNSPSIGNLPETQAVDETCKSMADWPCQ